jgi:recombination protein RecA
MFIFIQNMSKKVESTDKMSSLQEALKKIEKDFGQGAVMRLDEAPQLDLDIIPSGSLTLDHALGIGGYPRGRIVEIFGPESSGKTTLAIHAIAEAQKLGEMCAMIDAEHAFDRTYASALGVDMSMLYVSQPSCGEEALEIAETLISSGSMAVVVIDSVAALTPKAEIEGMMGDSRVGLQARLMSQALRKITSIVSKTNTCVIFINQLRDKIGVMFGNPETTTGGNALKFYASMRLDVRKSSQLKDGEEALGNLTKVKVVKNKCAPPFRKAEFVIEYGKGISKGNEVIDLAIDFDIIHKAGSWFKYEDTNLCQGRDKLVQILEDNPEMAEQIEMQVREKLANREDDIL